MVNVSTPFDDTNVYYGAKFNDIQSLQQGVRNFVNSNSFSYYLIFPSCYNIDYNNEKIAIFPSFILGDKNSIQTFNFENHSQLFPTNGPYLCLITPESSLYQSFNYTVQTFPDFNNFVFNKQNLGTPGYFHNIMVSNYSNYSIGYSIFNKLNTSQYFYTNYNSYIAQETIINFINQK